MVANIEEVLQRGEALSGTSKCSDLPTWPSSPPPLLLCPPPSQCLTSGSTDLLLSTLAALDSKASNLSSLSKKYRSDAKYLNTRSTYAKLAAGGVFFIMLIVYVRFWWLWGARAEEREVLKWRIGWIESEDTKKFHPQPLKKKKRISARKTLQMHHRPSFPLFVDTWSKCKQCHNA